MALETTPGSFFYVLEDPVKILYVDDDPIMREFAVVHLSTDKAEVAVRTNGAEAIEALETGEFDLVLMDLEMPHMDGFEALARLRSNDRTRRLPVIVVSGREDLAAVDRAFQAGATTFLIKPINWRLLSYQVRYIHRNHRIQSDLLRQRAEAHAEMRRAQEALLRLSIAGAELLRQAMRGPPEIRRAAEAYAALLKD